MEEVAVAVAGSGVGAGAAVDKGSVVVVVVRVEEVKIPEEGDSAPEAGCSAAIAAAMASRHCIQRGYFALSLPETWVRG